MPESTASTAPEEIESPSRSGLPSHWLTKVPFIALGPNELASTDRYWAAKPPPGMESDPLDWDEITKL
jgi:hypothetical protein